jgi:predicted nucleic acid-binding protein
MALVLDASVALRWAFTNPTPYADHVLGMLGREDGLVPSFWPVEVANGIITAERRNQLDVERRAAFLNLLRQLDIIVEATEAARTLSIILDMARVQGLTAYDAMYLELALREGIPLATEDVAMRDAAVRIGVPLVTATAQGDEP